MIHDREATAEGVRRMLGEPAIVITPGRTCKGRIDGARVHVDREGPPAMATALPARLDAVGIEVAPMRNVIEAMKGEKALTKADRSSSSRRFTREQISSHLGVEARGYPGILSPGS